MVAKKRALLLLVFATIAPSTPHWRLEAQDNAALPAAPAQQGALPPPIGQRHSTAAQAVDRDYLLIPGYELGLIVLDVTYPVTALSSSVRKPRTFDLG